MIRDLYFPGAILLIVYLLATAVPVSAPVPVSEDAPGWEEYGRVFSLEELPAGRAFLLRFLSIVFLTLLLSGLAINLQCLIRGGWRIFPEGETPGVPWGVKPVLKLGVYFLALFLSANRLERILLGLAGIDPRSVESRLLLFNAFLQFALLLGLSKWFLRRYRPGPGGEPGLFAAPRPGGWIRRGRQALKGYICFFPLLIVLGMAAWGLTRVFDLPWQVHPLVEPLLEAERPSLICPLLVVGVILAPLAEEVFFRGLLFPALVRRIGPPRAAAVTAALFATLHFNWFGWLPIFGLGVLLARSYQRTGSLLVPVLIHAFHNGLFLSFAILSHGAA